MQHCFGIFNSNQVSKHDIQLPISALEDGIWQTSVYGMQGLYFDYQKILTVGYFLTGETDKDFKDIRNARKTFLNNMTIKYIKPYQSDFINELGDFF
ncbi:hypothetical protein [Ichthyobacterium seriolicida]|uniref:hypothetical protein n=1 Tax=Ichthyobacterium seriolicida TaxID=242600 RepID=UPI000BBBF10B|nr:hypothetical protein [Ichthyobacterium seriolicida]